MTKIYLRDTVKSYLILDLLQMPGLDMLFFDIIYAHFIVLQFITIGYLSYHSISKRLPNIGILIIGYCLALFCTLLVAFTDLSWNDVVIPFMMAHVLVIPFTYCTFHRNMKKNYHLLNAIVGILFIGKIIFAYIDEYYSTPIIFAISLIFETLLILISFGWLGFSALQVYHDIQDLPVEHYVKFRLRVLGIISWIYAFNGFPQFLQVIFNFRIEESSGDPIVLFTLTILVLFSANLSIGNLIGWVFPGMLKKCQIEKHIKSQDLVRIEHDKLESDELKDDEILNALK